MTALGLLPFACSGRTESDTNGTGASAGTSKGGGSAGTKPTSGAGKGNASSGSGGRSGTSGSGGLGGAGGVAGGSQPTCTDPQLDPKSGLVSCAEGYRHRPKALECEVLGATPGGDGGAGGATGGAGGTGGDSGLPRADGDASCFHNPDACQAFELGYCDEETGGGGNPGVCFSGCVNDGDCGDGSICVCDGPSPTGGRCQPSDCKADSECGPGYLCASYTAPCGGEEFACQKAQDECWQDADCGTGFCSKDGDPRYCEPNSCQVGRPFLVADALRLPPIAARADWQAGMAPRVDHLGFGERGELAAHWTKLGQMEHASIAAFARFSLQLLSLGAPPALVEACTQALADETAHTKLCFGIASAYAGRAIGPGPLDVSGALEVTSLAEIVELVIVEGCFGETGAVLEALEGAEAAADPVIREAYSRIASDEQRHAELAFRFVRWALEQGGAAVRDCIEAALHGELAQKHPARGVAAPCLSALVTMSRAA